MSKQREAMQFALDTLEDIFGKHKIDVTAINMLREALAEPEQEPVAWMMVNEEHGHKPTLHWKPQEDWHITWKAVPLYTAPPTRADGNHFGDFTEMAARKPLTDEEITVICMNLFSGGWREKAMRDFARAIEKAHGIGEK